MAKIVFATLTNVKVRNGGLEIKPRRKLDHPGIAAQYLGWIQKISSERCHLIQSCQTRSTHRIHAVNGTWYILRMIERVEEVSANLDEFRFSHSEVLEYGDIEIVDRRQQERVAESSLTPPSQS